MALRTVMCQFPTWYNSNLENPGIRHFLAYFTFGKSYTWELLHITWRNGRRHVKLIKSVLYNGELLQIWNSDSDLLSRANFADLKVKDVFAVGINFSIGSLLTLFDGLLVFFFSLFFLFDHSFYPLVTELSHIIVNTGIWMDGEAKLNFKKLFSGVDVLLL
jgi:hypothetical protein